MTQTERILVRTEGLAKLYQDDGVRVPALRGVDLIVHAGEFTAVVGPSGSGKTTLLNLISGLDKPTQGEVWLDGTRLTAMSGAEMADFRRDRIGFVFQAFNLIPVLTIEENIEYVMQLQNVAGADRRLRVRRILAEVGLEGSARRFPPQLSGGQQQRVAIARAMVTNPSLILADEPTANIDSKAGSDLLDMMRRLNEERGMTFIFSTHDRMVMDKARRVILLRDGLIEEDRRA